MTNSSFRAIPFWWLVAAVLTAVLFWLLSDTLTPAAAHGTAIDYSLAVTVDLQANYDSGEPMSEAQITVYAPSDPQTPYLQGIADENGRFIFEPDTNNVGLWSVAVRTAGHGEIISTPVSQDEISGAAVGGQSTLQRIVMSVSVIWGFVGTALYFQARQKNDVNDEG